MAAGLTLDTGALIAADRNDRRIWTLLKESALRDAVVTVPPVVLAQAWRGNHPRMAQALQGCRFDLVFSDYSAKRVGVLLAESRTTDVVDAIVVVGAIERYDSIVTSDPKDIERLIEAHCRLYSDEVTLLDPDRNRTIIRPLREVVRVLRV